jgi:hypothetical protein
MDYKLNEINVSIGLGIKVQCVELKYRYFTIVVSKSVLGN